MRVIILRENSRLDDICSAYMKIKDKASNYYIKQYLIAQEYTTTNENEWTLDQRRRRCRNSHNG